MTQLRSALFFALFILVLPRAAHAEPIDARALRLVAGLEVANGRLVLLPQDSQSRPHAAESLLVGARVGLDIGLAPHFALEVALAAEWYAMRDLGLGELHVAPRVRWVHRERNELYLRPVVGVAVVGVDRSHLAFVGGFGLGFRRQVTTRTDVFVEIGYRLRFMSAVDASYAARTWDGFSSTVAPNGLACFLGLTSGVGFGR